MEINYLEYNFKKGKQSMSILCLSETFFTKEENDHLLNLPIIQYSLDENNNTNIFSD